MSEYLATAEDHFKPADAAFMPSEPAFVASNPLDITREQELAVLRAVVSRQAAHFGATVGDETLASLDALRNAGRFYDSIVRGETHHDPARSTDTARALGLDWTPATLPAHDQQAGAAYVAALDYGTRTNRLDLAPWPAFRAAWHRRDYATHTVAIVANGYRTALPILTGRKAPAPRGWSHVSSVEPSAGERAAMLDTFPHCGIGIAGGAGFLWIDVDQPAQAAAWRAELAALTGYSPDALPVRLSPKEGRFAYLLRYRGEPGERVPNGSFAGNDVRGHGAQVVVAGAHPSGLGDYQTVGWHPATTPASFHHEIDWTELAGVMRRVAVRCGLDLDQIETQIATLDRSRFTARASVPSVGSTITSTSTSTGSTSESAFIGRVVEAAESNPAPMLALCFPGQTPAILSDGSTRYVAHWTASGRGVALADRDPNLAVYSGAGRFRVTDYGDGERGYNAITLTAAALGIDNATAIARLADLYSIGGGDDDDHAALVIANAMARQAAERAQEAAQVPAATASVPEPAAPVYEPPKVVSREESDASILRALTAAMKAASERDKDKPAPWFVARARPGSGKTHHTVQMVADLFAPEPSYKLPGAVLYVGPRHDMTQQTQLDLSAHVSGSAMTYLAGRSHADSEGVFCQQAKLAEILREHHPKASVKKALCDACPFRQGCRYLAQIENTRIIHRAPHVYFTTHAALVSAPAIIPTDIAITFVDEDIVGAVTTKKASLPLKVEAGSQGKGDAFSSAGYLLTETRHAHKARPHGWHEPIAAEPTAFAELQHVVDALAGMPPNTLLTADRLADAGIELDTVKALARAGAMMREFSAAPEIGGGAVAVEFANKFSTFWRAFDEITHSLLSVMSGTNPNLRCMLIKDSEDGVVSIRVMERKFLPEHITKRPLVVLDGTADLLLLQWVLGREIGPESVYDAHPSDPAGVQTIAILDAPVSNKAMTRPETGVLAGYTRLANAIKESHGGNVGIITSKSAFKASGGELERIGVSAHYGATSGLNTMSKVEGLMLAGRDLPKVSEMIAEKLALTGCDMTVPADSYHKTKRQIRMRDGGTFAIEIDAHPDPVVNALLCRATDAQILQAAERGRAVQRDESRPLTTYLSVGRLPPEIIIDKTVRWGATKGGLAHDVLEVFDFLPIGRPGALDKLCMSTSAKAWPDMAKYAENHGWPTASTSTLTTPCELIDHLLTGGRKRRGSDLTIYKATEPRHVWQIATRDRSPTDAQEFTRSTMGIAAAHVEGAASDKALASFANHGIATDNPGAAATLDSPTWPTRSAAQKTPGGLLDVFATYEAAPETTALYRVTPSGASAANSALVVIDLDRHLDAAGELARRFVSANGRAPKVELADLYAERIRRLKARAPQSVLDVIAGCQIIITDDAAEQTVEPMTDDDLMPGESLPDALVRLMLAPGARTPAKAAGGAPEQVGMPWDAPTGFAPGELQDIARAMGLR